QAETHYQEVVRLRKKTLGEVHPAYADAVARLSQFYSARDKPAQAEPILRRLLAVREQLEGDRSPAYLDTLDRLATVYLALDKPAEAEKQLRRAVELARKGAKAAPEVELVKQIRRLLSLADIRVSQKDFHQAEPPLREVFRHCFYRSW